MAKQLNVDLNFRANTTQAQQQIQQLQTSLTQIAAAGTVGIGGEKITAEMKQASAAAKELQMHLSKAMNTQTGTLDLNRLNNSLTGAKTNLQTLSSSLLQIGSTGTTAFTQLATAVSQADRPMLALNGKLTQLWTVMKNTAKWQLSSSMIHGFIGGVSQAYRYAQDLNESLNNIRIVTGYSAERMEEFAIQANKAAKALSTTTNEYTKASLIYFQQGLSDQQVKDRTDVTIKMANVSRQSAEIVSDQMTAVWNNFYDGSKSLEHYANVMVKLGAETASSSDEIAGGLEKFAAIGETVGLSFEYAASALATITAETRQSEEVVGTSLKTIFARIQGLNMGETLEDGTDFNKYSKTLATIGVNIKDQNGQLKDMDDILDELGAKWGTLARDQQMAVAQNVAGLRQYNQFISLMSNWDVMQENLERSNNASGALDKQAELYAESWEAARNRVTASAEAIYDALLNDEFFIDLNNIFSGLLDSVNGFIDEIGGLKTIMIGAFGLLASYLGNKIQPMINNLRANFQVLFTGASQQAINLGNSMQQAIEKAKGTTGINLGFGEKQQLDNAQALIIAKNKLSSVNKSLNSEERFLAETELQLIQMEQDKALALAKTREQLEKNIAATKEQIAASNQEVSNKMMSGLDSRWASAERGQATASLRGDTEAVAEYSARLEGLNNIYWQVDEAVTKTSQNITTAFINSLQQSNDQLTQGSQLFAPYIDGLRQLESVWQLSNQSHGHPVTLAKEQVEAYIATLPQAVRQTESVTQAINNVRQATSGKALKAGVEELAKALEQAGFSAEKIETIMEQVGQGSKIKGLKADIKDLDKTIKELTASQERLKQAFANFQPAHNFTGVERMTAMASALSSVAMAVMSVKTIFSSWANEDMSFGEKLTSSLMGLGMLWPSLTGMVTNFGKALGFANIHQAMQVTKTLEQATASQILTAQLTAEQLAQKTGISLDQAEVIMSRIQAQAMMEEAAKRGVLGGARMKEVLAEKLGITAKQASTIMSEMKAGASWKEALATAGVTGGLNLNTKAIWANVAATWAWLWPILAIIGAIALLIGGLKLASSIYNADAKAAEKAGEAAEKAAKQFEDAQNKYNEFKDTISNHDEAIEGLAKLTKGTIEYKEQIMKANEEALKLINSQDLLYGTDYKHNDEGLIEFTPGRLEQARKQEFNNLERLEANKSFTAQRAKTAEEKANLTEFARNNLNDDGGIQSEDWSSLIKGTSWAASGAAIGATLGTVVPVIGNAVGAIGGAIIGGIAGLGAGLIDVFTDDIRGDSSDNEIETMRKLAEAYDKQGEAALKPENIKEILGENNTILDDVFAKPTAEMTKALIEEQDPDAKFDMEELNDLFTKKGEDITPEDLKVYFDQNGIKMDQTSIDQMFQSVVDSEVKSQIASLAANTAAIRGHIERTAGAANQDNEAYQRLSEEDQAIADKIIANRVDDALADKDSEAYAQLEKDAVKAWQEEMDTNEKGFFKGDENLTYDKYMEITYGKDWKDNYKVENMGGTNATIYQMKDGKWENIDPDDKKNTLSNDEVKEALVEYYAKQYGDADAAKLAKVNTAAAEVRANVGGIGTIADQDIKSAFASGETADLSFMTKEQVDELKAELENGTIKVTDEYKKLLLDGANAWSEAAHEARKEAEANSVISEGASKYGLDEKVLKAQADMLQQTHKGLKNNAVAAAEMAVANQRLNKGVNKLTDNWKDWNKTLRSSDKTTQDYAEAVVGVQDAMRDMFGLTEDAVIPEDFLQDTENLDLLNQIANGSEEAAQKLHFNLTKAQIEAEEFSADIAQNMINAFDFGDDVDLEATFNEMKTQALNALTEIQGMANGVDIGAGLKDPAKQAQMAAKLNEYAMAAGWTAEQMQSALASVGVRAKITMIEGNPVTKKIPITRITRSFPKFTSMEGPDGKTHYGFSQDETSEVVGYKEVTEPTLVPQIDMEDPNNPSGQIAPIFEKVDMGNITPSVTSGGKNSGGGGGGGGGDKPKVVQKKAPIKPKKEKDEIERYHEISKAIEDQERVVDRLSKAKDKAYGANKLKAIDNEIAALQKLNELDSQHLKQIREKLALDRKAAAEEHGITFDEFGRINNYEEIIKQKMEWWRTEQQKIQDRETEYEKEKNYNEEYDADGAIKLKIDQDKEKIDEQYEDFKEAITQYEETFGLFEDTVDKMQDQFDQMAEKAIEKITYEVEFKVEFEESAIDLLDFQIELLGEDFDAFAEIASITMEKTTHLSKALQAQSDGVGALYEAYDKGAISLDQFVENMKESLPDILSSMQNMISLDKEMMEYYSKAFDAAEEKFTEYLDFIDSGISKLDHFQNMLSLIGKEQNYDMLGVVLESQYTSASHRLQASSDWYETTKKEYDALYNRWIAEKNLLGPKELEMLEEKLKVARTKMQEADEQRLSDLEAVGEKAQEILQNNLNMARKKFEENLVGSSLEDYMNELDRLSKKQEEYLTNTNKMYETNKLIRQAQMEMDKTDNNRAKQQYNDYVKYIEQLQETGKLSSYELSVAQAKYELLQAQIALEEAKDTKDQVRLTRDSEGNYGYVYTANEDKVSDAEQAVADAENKLYNIGLEGAQDYQSKKAEILQEAIDTFASIEEQYQTGQIKTEAEFNAKMEEAKQYYYNRLKEYDNLYYMALGVMQEESYGNTIDYELDSRNVFDTFATHVDGYLGDVEQSFTDYNNKVGVVKQEVGDDLEAMRKKTEEVTKETEKLTLEAEKLTDQIDNELLSVHEATSIWGAYRDELYKNIEANKTLIEQLRTIQELQGGELADYSSFISDQVAKGKGYDDRLIQEALSKRWLKMEGVDNYDYTQKKIDYVQEYADLNGLTFEEAETALQDDAWYKTLGILRQYKIERTDWAAKKKEILEKDPKADVSWIDNIIAEKLSYDWAAKIQQYIERNPGLKYDDEYLQEMLTIRQIKIDSLKNPKDVTSNEELLAPYIEKGVLIDNRKNISSAVSAATGGYTGEWGPEGKIAILHEKELILNAQDTKNFLSAVEILREINDILDQNALVASLGAINLQALSLNSSADQVLQQEVTIHADFPNVTDHNEIELAIDNLINAASQHAYRT